ncbi:lamin tail domain-containing protein [Flavihumibacter sp. UBA7668]|uniref:lamin tail domain-containing protein n=1 Tax=Flavihumibacter sp. UBA7668 TaxID=1946542 RepID=UPI0025B7FB00|nr:lamin tail domain-containing protein [Flavihumibacter sp. UBA7668]
MWKWIVCCISLLNAETLAGQGFPVVISELMGDPLPSVGLPAEEYIELTNVSSQNVDLSGWTITNGRTRSLLPEETSIEPGEFLIICASRALSFFQEYGKTIGLSPFPVISNAGDTILLLDKQGKLIHAAAHLPAFFSPDQADGGWSLELVNKSMACRQTGNWKASNDARGGSPGKANPQDQDEFFQSQVDALFAWCPTDSTIRVMFSDGVNREEAERNSNYSLTAGYEIRKVKILEPFQQEVELLLNKLIDAQSIYSLTISGIGACSDAIGTGGPPQELAFGLDDLEETSVLINEILFDPSPEGSDYIEFIHTGKRPVNLARFRIANRDKNGDLSGLQMLVSGPRFMYPGNYFAITMGVSWLKRRFHVKVPHAIVGLSSLPSMPNEEGKLVLIKEDSTILDELHYSANWHHEMLGNKENVSLERRNSSIKTQESANWISAAMHAGYGTPGYENSQSLESADQNKMYPETEVFSPDGDGIQDHCSIQYQFVQAGYLTSIRIYNRQGLLQRVLVNNVICAPAGKFIWDGTDNKGRALPNGLYLLIADTWHVSGKTKRYRMSVTLGKIY